VFLVFLVLRACVECVLVEGDGACCVCGVLLVSCCVGRCCVNVCLLVFVFVCG
jgi:hypothetical protein